MLVVQVATTVTPSWDLPDPTVHDKHNCARDPAACRGDVASTDQISVPCESTVRAVEIPSAWFCTRHWHSGQVDELPRSLTSCTVIPAR
jgi:hypothetical protein